MRRRSVSVFVALVVLIGSIFLDTVVPIVAQNAAAAGARNPWQDVLANLRERRDKIDNHLVSARDTLDTRLRHDAPELLPRLFLQPPLRRGYGLLPEIVDSPPLKPITLRASRFSLRTVSDRSERTLDFARDLAQRSANMLGGSLAELVADFEDLRSRLRRLDKQIAYHTHWQSAVISRADYFAERNRLLRLLEAAKGDRDRLDLVIFEQRPRIARFYPRSELKAYRAADGKIVLPVSVVTDIEDSPFLDAFRDAVDAAFVHSAAARERGFAVELTLREIKPDELYPDGAPATGEQIALGEHVKRFSKGAFVLTTGASHTNVLRGRYIIFGPSPVSHRTLAHEFGHLLGLDDAYLRGYEGGVDDPFGVVLVEWTGLTDDLMGNPGEGRVSGEMVDRLIDAYLPTGHAGDAPLPDGVSYLADAIKIEPYTAPIEVKGREGLPRVHTGKAPLLDGMSYVADTVKIEPLAAPIEVKVRKGLLTVNARDAPLANVLRVIGENAGFAVTIKGNLSIPVTVSFAGVRMDKAIRRLVGENSWTMIYGPSDADGRAAGPSELRVYAHRARDMESAAAIQPAAIQPAVIESDVAALESSPASSKDSILKDLARPERAARMRAIGILGRLKDENTIDILVQVLLAEEDAFVRRYVVVTLGRIGGDRAIETLAEVSHSDPDDMVRKAADSALSRWR